MLPDCGGFTAKDQRLASAAHAPRRVRWIGVLGPVNTYAVAATAVVNRQRNEEGAAKGGSLGATTDAAMAVHGPVPKGYGEKSACRRCEPWPLNYQGRRLAPRQADF
jgi:hypothetical protein